MISFKTGDLLAEDAEALVNTVNCVGVMGRGIALQFKKAFPDHFRAYAAACKRGEIAPGRMFVFETGGLTNPRYIINFPTKRHWRGASRMGDIQAGLDALVREIGNRSIASIAIPPLGSGLGGLDRGEVRPLIEEALRGFDALRVVVFELGGAPEADKMARNRRPPKMTKGRAALIGLMHRCTSDPAGTVSEAWGRAAALGPDRVAVSARGLASAPGPVRVEAPVRDRAPAGHRHRHPEDMGLERRCPD